MVLRTTSATGPASAPPAGPAVVHAVLSPAHGVVWWLERHSRWELGAGLAAHPGALPAAERRALARSLPDASLRAALTGPARTVRVLMPVRDGVPVRSPEAVGRVPQQRRPAGSTALEVVALPVAAPDVATSLAALRCVAEGPALLVGREVRHLAALVRDVERLVEAGRVVPEAVSEPGTDVVRATWRLAPDEDVRAWIAAHAAALPPALSTALRTGSRGATAGTAEEVLAGLLDAVVPVLVRERAAGDARVEPVLTDAHPLLTALVRGTALGVDASRWARLRADLATWVASHRRRRVEVVLRLQEPRWSDDEVAAGDDAAWPVDVLVRLDGAVPEPLAGLTGDREAVAALRDGLRRALTVLPSLRAARRDAVDEGRLWVTTTTALGLVEHGADLLREADVTLLLPRDWTRVAPSLRLDVQGSRDAGGERPLGFAALVSWDWSVALGGDVLTEDELGVLADAASPLVWLRGEWVRLQPGSLAAARRFVRRARQRRDDAPASLAGLVAELAGADALPVPLSAVTARGWVDGLLRGTEAEVVQVPVPAALQGVLRPYQHRGLSWLAFLDRLGLGSVLADDMGLGKTVQVLALLLHERDDAPSPGPTLLVCPMSLVGNWSREAARFAPTLRVRVHHGASRARGEAVAAYADADVVVTTYGVLASDVDELAGVAWHRLVLDEAHQVKNTATRQARAVRRVPAARRIALTGTPVENRLEELRGVLDAVNPGMLGSAAAFRDRFARPIELRADAAAASRLRAVTRPFVLRRVKTDKAVIADLPEKIEMVVPVSLTREQAALYRSTVDALLTGLDDLSPMQRKGSVLRTLTQLKQVCNHPAHFLGDGSPLLRGGRHRSGKLAAVDDLVESLLAEGDRALLFTQFAEFGRMLAPHLQERFGVEVPFLHGGTTRTQRDGIVRRFQSDDGPPLLLLSLKAGGTGLNLTRANHVLHVDRWWNPAVEDQATDRAFRIGQDRTVQVRKLVTAGTVEERIDAVIAGKSALADLVVGPGEGWLTELGTEALRELLVLSQEAVDA
ncbi:SNF2-related protein [Kineococcus rubinsiae]|uniref:SNF2-related protein n=1 Tax=Kineococcus rubinsiae TaxID=2609562 RepID=UPI00142FE937|nr:DEAD/DEAH box helicase [Kineococcus rubinsiae]NIZ90086.1 DEAD/DEAH box helicase [Kineococcus rubinsiae]